MSLKHKQTGVNCPQCSVKSHREKWKMQPLLFSKHFTIPPILSPLEVLPHSMLYFLFSIIYKYIYICHFPRSVECIKRWSAMWWISGGSGVAILPSVCGCSSSSLSLQWICLPCSNGKLTQIEWWIFWEDWDMSVARRLLRYYMK